MKIFRLNLCVYLELGEIQSQLEQNFIFTLRLIQSKVSISHVSTIWISSTPFPTMFNH